jgi:hypothetical protein
MHGANDPHMGSLAEVVLVGLKSIPWFILNNVIFMPCHSLPVPNARKYACNKSLNIWLLF